MRQWEPIEHKEAYCRWVLPARAWTKGRSLRGAQIKILFEEGEWLGGAYVSGDDDGPRFLCGAVPEVVVRHSDSRAKTVQANKEPGISGSSKLSAPAL